MNPTAIPWAELADLRYEILIASMDLYLRADTSVGEQLRGWCFAEMFVLSWLSQFLVKLPRGSETPGRGRELIPRAATPFNLPSWAGGAAERDDLLTALTESRSRITTLLNQVTKSEQKRILHHLASSDERKLAEAEARKSGSSVRTKADRARDLLDWVAGSGNPSHFGDSPQLSGEDQGRFWNLPLEEFKQTSLGANIIQPLPGEDAPLIDVLRPDQMGVAFMPLSRPVLPADSPEFQFLEAWINAGCPDEPA